MKAAIKDQWTKALRSGEFEQGTNYLDYIDQADGKRKQCCLGVLCRQAVAAGIIPEPELHNGIYRYLDDTHNIYGEVSGEAFKQGTFLPRKVYEWAGLTGSNVTIVPSSPHGDWGYPLSASEANDEEGYSFAAIADAVDANVPAE